MNVLEFHQSRQFQAEMLAEFLDARSAPIVDLVANDSGGAIAQLFVARYPRRVRSLLLTNCDVHEDSPPAPLRPFIDAARAGVLADQFIAAQLANKAMARGPDGLGGQCYAHPEAFTDEAIDCYFTPLLSSPLRKAQLHRYITSLEPNPLPAIAPLLRQSDVAVRMVWGTADQFFSLAAARMAGSDVPEVTRHSARRGWQRGVIPPDCWHDPYMAESELQRELAAGERFWCVEDEGRIHAVMGIQDVDVALIRHAYTRTSTQGRRDRGVGQRAGHFFLVTRSSLSTRTRSFSR